MQTRKSAQTKSSYQEEIEPTTLVDLLRLRANAKPGKPAYTFLSDGEAQHVDITYGELDRLARAIAVQIASQPVSKSRALLLYPPGLDFIAGFFGCLYAGVVAIPAYPPDPARLKRTLHRLEVIAEDAGATLVLTTGPVLSRLQEVFAHAPVLKSMKWLATDTADISLADEWRELATPGDALAFLQYTSGSTGKPKGVMLSHSNLIHNASLVKAYFELMPEDRFVSWLPTFHDMGFMVGVLQPLYAQIPAVLLSPVDFLQRPFRWLQAISRYRGTTSGGPNFAYDLCVRKISPEDRAALDLSSWTVAFNGAEPVRRETLERFAAAFKPCGFRQEALFPCYGLAEATLVVSGGKKADLPVAKAFQTSRLEKGVVIEATESDRLARHLVSVGRSLPDQQIIIVNPDTLTVCPPAQVGEVWVSGPSIAKGYWNKPAETEQTFNAHTTDAGAGPYLRTGDLGFLLEEDLFITGRLKDLIIIRGLNHYPQDIELTVERKHKGLRPGCGAAFSVEVAGEERLVVVHELDDRSNPDYDLITASVRRSVTEEHELQAYAVVFIKPGSIPKTSSGKIQRNACRSMFLEGALDEIHRSILDDSYEPPRNESFIRKALLAIESEKRGPVIESYIIDQAARVLRTSPTRLSPEQSLTALGLDSLMAIELRNEIELQLGVQASAADLLAGSSIRQLASLLVDRLDMTGVSLPVPSRPGEGSLQEYPLSYMQMALWFFQQLTPESAAYNISFAARLSSTADLEKLKSAFQSLVDRHACLRTTFTTRDGQPVQRVHRSLDVNLRKTDASAWSEEELNLAIARDAYRPFDLESGPVHRVTIFTQSAGQHTLLLSVHHIAIDGWSCWLLLDELNQLYAAERSGERQTLPPLQFEYADYVRWQDELLAGPEGERLFNYWRRELDGELPALELPTVRQRPPVRTLRGASHAFSLDRTLVAELKKLAAREGATLYMVLLSAFQILLHRYSGQEDILVGSPISARSRAEFEGIVGCFFNAVILRAGFSSDFTVKQFLAQVRDKVLGALSHQDYPSHLLAERLQPTRDPSRPPLFQATFILQKSQRPGLAPISFQPGQSLSPDAHLGLTFFPVERSHARMELELEMIEADNTMLAWFHYNRDLFDEGMIARLALHFRILLEGMIADTSRRLSDLPLLTSEEVGELIARPRFDADHQGYSGIEALFEEQVEKSPHRAAAVHNGNSVTFHELNEQANHLARLIRRLRND